MRVNHIQRKQNAVSIPLVLIVDDEPGLLRLFAGLVERLECEAIQAHTGADAIDILDEQTPDLLILDLAMPEVSGFQVLQYVRSLPRLDKMKVMILTARPNLVPEIEALGIDCWVSKPVMPRDFLDVVESLLTAQDDF
jgi:DNA-binding response OmpR family regulator